MQQVVNMLHLFGNIVEKGWKYLDNAPILLQKVQNVKVS